MTKTSFDKERLSTSFNKHKFSILLLLIILSALLIRLPYWESIPASGDEVNQTVYAIEIAQGRILPLVGNDAYAGPFYYYLLAVLLRLGITNPIIGRIIIMITGLLLVPATYIWVRILGNNKIAGLIATMLVATNPDLILLNSHLGGSTYLLPFFTTLFLLGLTMAVRQNNFRGLIFGAISGGLALQSNPVAGLVIIGGSLWLLLQTYRISKMENLWPAWTIVVGFIIVLIYSPVIIYNLNTDFRTVDVLQERSYLWEENPTLETTINNLRRLSLQTIRQVSGVVDGEENFLTLIGIPLLFLLLMIVGLVYTSRNVSVQPLLIITPFLAIFPIFSSHYGFIYVGRFTTLLIPIWSAVIGYLLAAIVKIARHHPSQKFLITSGVVLLIMILSLYPINSLFRYYKSVIESHQSEHALLDLSRYVVTNNQDEPIYLSTIDQLSFLLGVPYVPHAAFLLGDIHHEFLPPQQIIGRLYQNPGSAYLLLSHHDAEIVNTVAIIERVQVPANEEAAYQDYGLYRFDGLTPLEKPDFVLRSDEIPQDISPNFTLGGAVQLLGCTLPQVNESRNRIVLDCYWTAIERLPSGDYVGFVHLIDVTNGTIIAQDDHILGQERYPLSAWQSGEVIKEKYTLKFPTPQSIGRYSLFTGIYTWPTLTRLDVPENSDNLIRLTPVTIPSSE